MQLRVRTLEHICGNQSVLDPPWWDAMTQHWFHTKHAIVICPYCQEVLPNPLVVNWVDIDDGLWYTNTLEKYRKEETIYLTRVDKRTKKGKNAKD